MKMLALAGVLLSLAAPAGAGVINTTRSNTFRDYPRATAVTAWVDLAGPSDTQTVYTTLPSRDFVLTMMCVSPEAAGGIRLDAGGFGGIAHLGGARSSCQSFSPGVVLPRDSTVTCSTFPRAGPGDYFCMIAGVLYPDSSQ